MKQKKDQFNVFTDEERMVEQVGSVMQKEEGENFMNNINGSWQQNSQIDKARVYLPDGYYRYDKNFVTEPNSHVKCGYNRSEFFVEFTGKTVATPTYLGGITTSNVDMLPSIIEDKTGVIVSLDTLLNSRVTIVDVKRDVILPYPVIVNSYISMLREMGYQASGNTESFSFEKKLGFDHSVLIKTTTKTTQDSLSVYNKYEEMVAKKRNDGGYFKSIDAEYLEEVVKHIIRFERRIRGARDLRRAFHLHEKETVTLQKIFDCKFDVVAEKVGKIFHLDMEGK